MQENNAITYREVQESLGVSKSVAYKYLKQATGGKPTSTVEKWNTYAAKKFGKVIGESEVAEEEETDIDLAEAISGARRAAQIDRPSGLTLFQIGEKSVAMREYVDSLALPEELAESVKSACWSTMSGYCRRHA